MQGVATAPRRPAVLPRFDPRPYRSELVAIIRAVEALPFQAGPLAQPVLERVLRLYPKDGRGFFARSEIIAGFRAFAAEAGFASEEAAFVARLQRRPVRTQSGVAPVTVLTRPFPCPGRCVFCPNDVRMPKSYLSDEPGAQRAAANRFDPYLQAWNRLDALRAIGHPIDKVELIVLGGTWSFYPEAYQRWFATRLFEALNDFGAGIDGRPAGSVALDFDKLREGVDGRTAGGGAYNRVVSRFLTREQGGLEASRESATWRQLQRAQAENEAADARCVGLVLETRPDRVDIQEVVRLRRLGCTKVQIGIQSLDDGVLAANQRGHDVAATRRALRLLRGAGFKLHAHWMPNLLGATPESDLADFSRLFEDADFRPDELKVYPCSLIETAELMKHWQSGAWRPYEQAELLAVVSGALERTPRSCRLTRVIRDISSDDIVAGNKLTNFREIAARELERRGGVARDIRSREIRGEAFDAGALELRATEYATSIGREHFLEFATPEDRIVAFLRLSLPEREGPLRELAGSALLRELHVYGGALTLGARDDERAQHRGLGARLIEEAVLRAARAGYADLAVISAVGTRDYYRRLGFGDGALYQHRALSPSR